MKSGSLRALLLGISIALGLAAQAHAYAPLGHQIVGAIADERLANTPTAAKIRALIGGLSLEKAAVLADTIKGWDKKGVDNPKSFRVASVKIDRQLRDFWRANQPTHNIHSTAPSHHWFHYTDVPVIPAQTYGHGTVGRSKWDIVHMIPYCVEVLRGRRPEQNERKITKAVALILLAHYVADIHQPLHVGAQYFDAQGRFTDPNKDQSALADEGGNTFTLELSDEPPRTRGVRKKKLHAFWDYDAVNALFPQVPVRVRKRELQAQITPLKKQLVRELAAHEPKTWRMPANMDVTKYAEAWADEILPIARQAHERLDFTNVHPLQKKSRVVAAGEANEKPQPDQINYRAWAANIVREELHKAGWRLVDLLEKTL
jgi:S1/P1 Nuclease